MLDFNQIPISAADQALLNAQGIYTIKDLWQKVDEYQKLHAGNCIAQLSALTSIPEAQLRTYLATGSKLQGERILDSPFAPHIRSVGILLAIALFFASAYWARREQQMAEAPVVAEGKSVRAYQPLTESDVALQRVPFQPNLYSSISDVVGRYSAAAMDQGTPLTTSQLSANKTADLAGRILLPVNVRTLPAGRTARLPIKVTLLLVPTKEVKERPAPVDNVLLIAETRQGETAAALLALRPCDYQRIRNLLAICELTIVDHE